MLEKILGRRYAYALLKLAEKESAVDRIQNDLTNLLNIYTQSPDFARIINHPLIPLNEKQSFMDKTLGKNLHPLVIRFLNLLLLKSRMKYLSDIVTAYNHLTDQWHNVLRVKIKSFAPVPSEEISALEHKLQAHLKAQKLVFETILQPSLLGGWVIQIGDNIIDGSVAGRLNKIHSQLLHS
jgi:F-type H+-transporting ATPase subunit delta